MGKPWTNSAKVFKYVSRVSNYCGCLIFLMFSVTQQPITCCRPEPLLGFASLIAASFCITGIVGDVLLNHSPLRGFTIFSLDLKPGFMKRLVK